MIHTLAVNNYRSLRDVVLPLGPLTVVTGANGTGKSSIYRALRLLHETAFGQVTSSLAREGGLTSALWAGPEKTSRAMRSGKRPVQGGPRRSPLSLRLGFGGDDFSYAVDFGIPATADSAFSRDPEIKRESIWHGEVWKRTAVTADRHGSVVTSRDDDGTLAQVTSTVPSTESMLTYVADPARTPEILLLREQIRSWRFYDAFRTDADAPARRTQVGTRTPVLHGDGRDLAAALQTILEVGDSEGLAAALDDAFPGTELDIGANDGWFSVSLRQPGLLRSLTQAELSDGTLRYLLLLAALFTPRPPELMVLNEPETSLHPELIAPLGRLILAASRNSQVWVVTHSTGLVDALEAGDGCQTIHLEKDLSETEVSGMKLLETPPWTWPSR